MVKEGQEMRIPTTNPVAGGRAAPRGADSSAIDSQIKRLEKRKEKLQKELKDAGNPKEIERIAKEIQIVYMEIATLKATRENLAGNAQQAATQTPAAGEAGRDRYENAGVEDRTEKTGESGPSETTGGGSAEGVSEPPGDSAGKMPPLLGKRPGIYALEANEEGHYVVAYELEEERRTDEKDPHRLS